MAKGPRTLRITFGAETLTHYGGVYLLHRFLTRIGFKHALAQDIRLVLRTNRYSVGELFLAVLYPMILGLERIETTQLLRQNGVFQYLTGLPRYPEAITLRRFVRRVVPDGLPRLRALHDRLLRRMLRQPRRPSRLIFDVDSTVLVVYGKQEGPTLATIPSSVGGRPIIPCCSSRARARTSGTANCGRAMPIPRRARASCSRRVLRRSQPTSD